MNAAHLSNRCTPLMRSHPNLEANKGPEEDRHHEFDDGPSQNSEGHDGTSSVWMRAALRGSFAGYPSFAKPR